jgi:hypothetical protein
MADRRMRALTDKQAALVKAYLANGGRATEAYRLAYKPMSEPRNHSVMAQKALRAPAVAHALGRANKRAVEVISAEMVNRYAVDQASIAAGLANLGFTSISDVCTLKTEIRADKDGMPVPRQILRVRDFDAMNESARHAISKIKQDKDGQVTVELYDKRAALVDLARLMGLIQDKQVGVVDPVTGKPVDRFQPIQMTIIRKGGG